MATDPFNRTQDSPSSPAEGCFAITPDDNSELPFVTKGIYIGNGGELALVLLNNDSPVTFRNLVGGTILDVRAKAVLAAGSTATDCIGLY